MQGSAVSVVGITNWKLSDTASRQPHGDRTASHEEKAHCSLGLWCCQPYCFATVFCQSYDDFSGEIEAFWVHPDSLHILPLPDYRPGRYRVLHCQLLDTGAQESSSLYMRFLIHFFQVLRADSWWLVASFLEVFRARTPAHRPPLLPASSPWNAFILGDCPFTWSYWLPHSPTPPLPYHHPPSAASSH